MHHPRQHPARAWAQPPTQTPVGAPLPTYLRPSHPDPAGEGSDRQIWGVILSLATRKARKQPRELQSQEYRSNKQQVKAGDWCRRYEKDDRRVRSLRRLIKQQLPIMRRPFLCR